MSFSTILANPYARAMISIVTSQQAALITRQLLEKAMVVTVPGKEFGMEGHLRLSICGSIKDIKQGIERIKWVIDPQSPNELFIGEKKLVRDWL